MSKISTIIRNNEATFYNANTDERISTRPRLAWIGVASVFVSIIFTEQTDTFLSSIVSAQAILVGFSFSVMFYILSSPHKEADFDSIEGKLRERKLATLGTELFYNVSYFNLASIASVVISLILLAGSGYTTSLLPLQVWILSIGAEPETIEMIKTISRFAVYVTFYFVLVESLYTFIRTVGRVTYYFEKRLEAVS